MFKFNELKSIHLEITNNCQASCPMCARNIHGGIENPLLEIENWSLARFKTALNEEVLNQIERIYFCGNFGDPIINKDLPDMCLYVKETNPEIQVRIHTNGSARSNAWWIKLASVLPKDHSVIFAIDGLHDTHSMYRIGTSYETIIENASHFILAGGNAEWAFLRFKHNEHQVNEAKKIAKQIGFKKFSLKDSSRFLLEKKFPVWNKNEETIYHIEPSQYSTIKFIDKNVVNNYKEIIKNLEIDCFVKREKEIYLDAKGHLLPCCWISSLPYTYIDHEGPVIPAKNEMRNQYFDLVKSLGGLPKLDLETNSIKDIIESAEYQHVWEEYWTGDKKLITCARICGKNSELSNPNDQFTECDEL